MAAVIEITDLSAKDGAAAFHTEAAFVNTVDRSWEPEFKQTSYYPGQTIRIRRPAQFSAVESEIATPEFITEDEVSVTLRQFNVATLWTDIQKQLHIGKAKLSERVFQPMASELVATVESLIAQEIAENAMLDAGNTPGTVMGSFQNIADARARIMEQRPPKNQDIFGGLSYTSEAALLNNNKSLPNPVAQISNMFLKAKINSMAGVNLFGSPSVYRLLNGTIVNSDTSLSVALIAGTTQTMTSVGASKTVTAGMAFTIADVYEIDPQTKTQLPSLKVFRVAAAATSTGGGGLTVVLTEAVRQSTALVMLPLALPEGGAGLASMSTKDGIPVKTEFWRDAGNHKEYLRMDVLVGCAVVRPNWIAVGWGE
jgi:hypothetical protein